MFVLLKNKSRTRVRSTVLCIFLFIYPSPPVLAAEDLSRLSPLRIEEAVVNALSKNPRITTLAASAAALSQIPSQVGALPDPMLSLNAMNLPTDSFELDQEPMTQLQIIVSQRFPYPGKRALEKEAAQFSANAAHDRSAEYKDYLTGTVRAAWWQLYQADKALEIVAQNKTLLADFIEVAKTKYAVGKGLQQDVLLAELELSRLLDREVKLIGQRKRRQAILNGLMDRTPSYPIVLSAEPPNQSLPKVLAVDELISQAFEKRDLVLSLQRNVSAAEKRIALAEKNRMPDFNVGVGYGDRRGSDPLRGDRTDLVSLMFSFNLPIYTSSKQNKAIEQRVSEREQHVSMLDELRLRIQSDIGALTADYEASKDQSTLLKDTIIPQAEQTVASMLAGYEVNKVDFLNVVNGQIMLYNAQINYWDALSNAKQSLAKLAASVGEESIYE